MQRNVTCRWMNALYSLAVMFNAFPVVKGWGEEGKNGNLITTTQCNAMSLADECIILTRCHVPCIPSCEEETNTREEGENGNLIITIHWNTEYLVTFRWIDALYLLPVMFHAFPVVKGRTTWGEGRRNGNCITTTQCNTMSLADEWMHYTHLLSCYIHSQLWRGEQHEGEEGEYWLDDDICCVWLWSLRVWAESQLGVWWLGIQFFGLKIN